MEEKNKISSGCDYNEIATWLARLLLFEHESFTAEEYYHLDEARKAIIRVVDETGDVIRK